ncbi:uncharacterized protein [Dendrobates tinctorius]|uniref:uncharacterized protein n=1 Tax=Dendrobates tinctorius TaxID=92724 RepID=UPI003CC9DACE
MSWVDFLTQRQETSNRVTWAELEAWLFEISSPMRQGTPGASNAQILFHENDQRRYQGEVMDESRRLKSQWDNGGFEVIVRAAEGTTHARDYILINQMDLSQAVDDKYAALNEKLFCDMLQAHYGSQTWASMNNEQKDQNMNELKMLAEFGLERGSELVLSQLPGAAHNFRNEESSCSCKEGKKSWTAVQGLKELQRRLELEKSNLTSYKEESDLVCSVHKYLLLFAQKIKVKMECNFSAALLVVEPYWKQRFWDEKSVCLEPCFEELAHIRLTTGQRIKQKFEKEQHGPKKMSMEEDKILSLLKRQEDARDLLFHLLQSCSHEELQEPSSNLLHNPSKENMDPLKEVSETKVERNPLRQLFLLAMTVTKTCLLDNREMVTWGDCAERLLVQVQLKQELELSELIQELSRGVNRDDRSGQQMQEPVVEGSDPVSYLIQLLQPMTPKDQLNLEQFKAELVSSLECMKVQEESDNKNIKEAFDNRGMMFSISRQEESKNISVNDNSARNITLVDQQKKDVHLKIPEESSIKEKPQEKIHRRQKAMVSSMLREHEKEQGHQCERCKKEINLLMETPGRGTSKVATSTQNEDSEQTEKKHVEQAPSDELASSVMEATENLIAGLMILKAKVEEVYMKRGPGEHSTQRPSGSDTKAINTSF